SSASASTGADSLWQVGIAVPGAGGPYQMTISGDNRIVLEDILIGDVWVCSGQSNMELSMSRVAPAYPEDIAGADFPAIRQFYVPRHYNFKVPQADVASGDWVKATPETVPAFSAVAFYFGRELHRKTGVPIGLINASLGGSPSEAWLSEEALQAFPHYLEEAMRFRDDSLIANIEKKDNQRREAWYANLDALDRGRLSGQAGWDDPDLDDFSWAEMVLPGFWDQTTFGAVNGVMWFRKTVELPTGLAGQPGDLELGRIVDADSTFVNGVFVGNVTYQYPPRRYHIPEGVLKAGRNVIAVRVVNSSGRGGFVRDKPYRLSVAKDVFDLRGPWKFRLGGEMPPLAGPTFIRWKPMGLYNGMIAPLLKTGIKGVIWYQGESNTGNPGEYRRSFPAVIRDWRQKWGKGDFPFLFVQLANFMQQTRTPVESNWAALREAQQMALAEPNTAMAVTVDIGEWNDIHPLNKRAVGERLALGARHLAYGEKNLAYSGPLYRGMAARGREMVL
nr:sialate O-acetylesterase [Calditrichia bacterium]